MADVDQYLIDAIRKVTESDIEQRLYSKIRGDLLQLKFIGGIGASLIAVLALFHQSIFSFVVSQGGGEFKQEIKRSITTEEEAFKAMAADVRATRKIMGEELERLRNDIFQRHSDTVKIKAEFDKQQSELLVEKLKLVELIAGMKDTRDVITERIAAAQSTALQLQTYLDESTLKLNSVIRNQTSIVDDLKPSNTARLEKVEVLEPTRMKESPSANSSLPRKSTVYFQFAGFSREEAKSISEVIKRNGWSIPGEERTTLAINTNQIRFSPNDLPIAEALKVDADHALATLGLNITLSLKENSTVKEGVPEIWLYKR